mmetsp:Transcript_17391/g.55041  ORF Transcript_17391/g.55041 Transcript_17391/m.55041 type:complete len:240 (+) Transcript_17391:356-1075(+)
MTMPGQKCTKRIRRLLAVSAQRTGWQQQLKRQILQSGSKLKPSKRPKLKVPPETSGRRKSAGYSYVQWRPYSWPTMRRKVTYTRPASSCSKTPERTKPIEPSARMFSTREAVRFCWASSASSWAAREACCATISSNASCWALSAFFSAAANSSTSRCLCAKDAVADASTKATSGRRCKRSPARRVSAPARVAANAVTSTQEFKERMAARTAATPCCCIASPHPWDPALLGGAAAPVRAA